MEKQVCDKHLDLATTLARLEEKLDNAITSTKTHIENSRSRNAIVFSAIVTIILAMFRLAFVMGENSKQIQINTARWEQLIRNEGLDGRKTQTISMPQMLENRVVVPRG